MEEDEQQVFDQPANRRRRAISMKRIRIHPFQVNRAEKRFKQQCLTIVDCNPLFSHMMAEVWSSELCVFFFEHDNETIQTITTFNGIR